MIDIRNVSFKSDDRLIFDRFNLTIVDGEKIVFSAPSRSGKTCLLKLILGFIYPDEGQIYVDNKRVSPDSMQWILGRIGYLSQGIDFPNGKVSNVFEEIFKSKTNSHIKYSEDMLKRTLKKIGLSKDILSMNTIDISGNTRQRLGWALIMILDRPILLLDEPTSAMDKEQKLFFINYVMNTNKTVICSSHDEEWLFTGVRTIHKFNTYNDGCKN